ncbi:MAG: pentapeptide repeat-containing protein [Anaerolineae bacterium]|nr:pentapeptide repeat-containing protein [Anaerolineae bacterium]
MYDILKEQHPGFRGNWQDLEAFMKLTTSPIRTSEREQALLEWDAYKTSRQRASFSEAFGGRKGAVKFDASSKRVVDLSGATLDGICIGFANLRGVIFDGASMRGAKLKGTYMEHCSLRDVDFSPFDTGYARTNALLLSANLRSADLERANLSGADLSKAVLTDANLTNARLSDANLSESILVRTNLTGADLTHSRIYGIAAWDLVLDDDETKRRDLIVTPENQSSVRVDDIEVAQFIYMLLNRKNLRNVINAITRRGVLILGRFGGGGIEVLRAIADQLRENGYIPMLFDFDKPDDRDTTETVQVLAGLARFMIVDLSGPSVPQELMATVPHYEIPCFSILEKGRKRHSMFPDLFKYGWVARKTVVFADMEELHQLLPSRIIEPAEKMLKRILKRKGSDYQ